MKKPLWNGASYNIRLTLQADVWLNLEVLPLHTLTRPRNKKANEATRENSRAVKLTDSTRVFTIRPKIPLWTWKKNNLFYHRYEISALSSWQTLPVSLWNYSKLFWSPHISFSQPLFWSSKYRIMLFKCTEFKPKIIRKLTPPAYSPCKECWSWSESFQIISKCGIASNFSNSNR